MYKYGQAEIVTVAGYDAAAFMRMFAFGEFLSILQSCLLFAASYHQDVWAEH